MTCIATDPLYAPKNSTIAAELAVKLELESLFNKFHPDEPFLAITPSSRTVSHQDIPVFTWQPQGCPKKALEALQNCKLWILFTDGALERDYNTSFKHRVSQLSATKYPCVFIVFGSCSDGPPPFVKHHVCDSTFAEARDALLLFHDVDTDQTYILQAKGCFWYLIEDGVTIDQEGEWEDCKWSQLRRLRYEELLTIKLPIPKHVTYENQLTIHDGRIVTNKELDLMEAEKDIGEKFDLQRLQDIIRTAGEKEYPSPRPEKPTLPVNDIPRVDVDGQASHVIYMIFMNLDMKSMGIEVPDTRIDEYRTDLRAAHKTNRLAFKEATMQEKLGNQAKSQKKRQSFILPATDPDETFLPGFVRAPTTNRNHSEFRGKCMLCYQEDSILVLLMHYADLVTPSHLSHIHLQAIFNNLLVCDACAFHIPMSNEIMEQDIVAKLPLVSIIDNEESWTAEFGKMIGTVEKDEVLMMVWKWLNTHLGYDVGDLEEGVYKDALRWVLQDLGKWVDTTRGRRK